MIRRCQEQSGHKRDSVQYDPGLWFELRREGIALETEASGSSPGCPILCQSHCPLPPLCHLHQLLCSFVF